MSETQNQNQNEYAANALFEQMRLMKGQSAFVIIGGMGTDDKELYTKKIKRVATTYLFPYASSGFIQDFACLVNDAFHLSRGDFTKLKHTQRLNDLVALLKELVQDKKNTRVITSGISHGTIIMYAALLKIIADPAIDFQDLKKLRFYPVSSPILMPANFLLFARNEVEKHPFMQFYCINDPFYSDKQQTESSSNIWFKAMFSVAQKLFSPVKARLDAASKAMSEVLHVYHANTKTVFINGFGAYDEQVEEMMWNWLDCKGPNGEYEDVETTYRNMCMTLDYHANPFFVYPILPNHFPMTVYCASPFMQCKTQAKTMQPPQKSTIKRFMDALWSSKVLPSNGGAPQYVHILGRKRKVVKKGRWSYVTYKKELITLEQAHRIAQRSERRHSRPHTL